ncbi:MAG TPA: c-type cytochrome biogenesis protein CcmI [Acetobacteraceae bacterium]|nr:c-type cytochrome biogenesis protein CcmI [Acetobacteraceae bacterium]
MIWLGIALLAAVALAPLAWTLLRGGAARGRREAALALHRAQLAELDRDLTEGRIAAPEHALARLEVQRRLLAEAGQEEAQPSRAARAPILIVLALVPLAALGLYLIGGQPGLPAQPLAARIAAARQEEARDNALIERLRQSLAQLDPHSERAREGYLLLGQVEASRGHMAEAAAAWGQALEARFDPTLAVETAEATSEAAGRVTGPAADLFRRALAEAPADAPWRKMAEKRLTQAGGTSLDLPSGTDAPNSAP